MMKFIKPYLALCFCLVFSGCKESSEKINSFTFETGVDSEVTACVIDEPSSLEIKELGNMQIVDLTWDFPCNSNIDKPYLTATRNKGATLVINSDYGRQSCSCTKKISVKISERLDTGDIIYIVANKEVVGHKLLTSP